MNGICVRPYTEDDIAAMCGIWNEVVEEGAAFPQEEPLDAETGKTFFASQSHCGVAVDEETVRLRSHIAQYRSILELDEPVGRKLDFLTQELNRETNTIGSKCQDLDITRIVVDMKAEIEKIREQIQNLE